MTRRALAWLAYYWPEVIALTLVAGLIALVASCSHGAACPRAIGNGEQRLPSACCPPPPKACAHAKRLPIPPAPLLVGDIAIDQLRLEEHRRRLELWAARDWWSCEP